MAIFKRNHGDKGDVPTEAGYNRRAQRDLKKTIREDLTKKVNKINNPPRNQRRGGRDDGDKGNDQ